MNLNVNTLFLFWLAGSLALSATPDSREVVLAEAGRAALPVVTAEGADPETVAAADALAETLGRMGRAEFERAAGAELPAIRVGTKDDFAEAPYAERFSDDPFASEAYAIHSGKTGLWLIGATPAAVKNAVWDLLFRLGYRQFFPGKTWEVVPESDRISVSLDVFERPDFVARRIWYNWGMNWGYNREPYREWCERNRMRRGVNVRSGHAYGAIVAANRSAFEEHPEYYALVDGERKGNKLCISNPGLRELVKNHARAFFRKNPEALSISMEPSDGGGWCECAACRDMGSPSDRALWLANEVAEAVNELGLGEKYVGMYAYNMHCAPPSIKVHPNVVVSVATAFLRGDHTLEEIIDGWSSQGARLGIYDYFSVVAWDWNLPRRARAAKPHGVAESIRKYHEKGARFYDCESGDAWGPYGLGYYVASRVFWDVEEADRVDAIVADFIQKAFGPAAGPMTEFYDLIHRDTQRRSIPDILARMYRRLAAARALAEDSPEVKARIDALVLYARYVELYENYAGALGDAKETAKNEVLKFCYRIRKTGMVHSYGLWARLIGQKAAHTEDHPLKDDRPVTEAELQTFLREGMARFEPVEIDFEAVAYSENLVPAARALNLPDVPPGTFPNVPQSRHTYFTWVDAAPAEISLVVRVKKVWAKRDHEIQLFSPKEVDVKPVDVNRACRPDNEPRTITLSTPYRGLHRVEVYDGADFTRIEWPEDLPVTIPSGLDTKTVNQQFRGPWTLYFYVPRGTKWVGGWAKRIASWAPRMSGVMKNADGEVVCDFGKADEGWFRVPVAEGQDGRLWKFENNHGERRLVTVPPYLAPTGKQLLLPAEVVERDQG